MIDYIANYLENIRDRRVRPTVEPGYMRDLLPDSAPILGENWEDIFKDIEGVIMPGITHWQSPHMHAYFPALNSFPSLLGDMLADAINCIGFTWASSPACTELEIIVLNWLGKMIGLPDSFLNLNANSRGGGVIQTTASEATLVSLLAGRTRAIHRHNSLQSPAELNTRLVAYCSDQAHSSVEKASLIGTLFILIFVFFSFINLQYTPNGLFKVWFGYVLLSPMKIYRCVALLYVMPFKRIYILNWCHFG